MALQGQNAYSNEMSLLMTGGENFGQCTEPDYLDIINNWNLTKEKIKSIESKVAKWADAFFNKYPNKRKPWESFAGEDCNFWYGASMVLSYLRMELND